MKNIGNGHDLAKRIVNQLNAPISQNQRPPGDQAGHLAHRFASRLGGASPDLEVQYGEAMRTLKLGKPGNTPGALDLVHDSGPTPPQGPANPDETPATNETGVSGDIGSKSAERSGAGGVDPAKLADRVLGLMKRDLAIEMERTTRHRR